MSEDRSSEAHAAPATVPMGQLLAYHAVRRGKRPAVTYNDVSLTFGELDARANRRARQLAARGVAEGGHRDPSPRRTALNSTRAAFAIWKLGATPNVVSSKLPAVELRAILELAKPKLVIGESDAQLDGWAHLSIGESPGELSAEPLPPKVSPIWKIMTSAGSTGRPKLIVANQPGVYDPGAVFINRLPGDTVLNPGPLYHNAPFVFSFPTLFTGGHVVDMGRFDPLEALRLIERYKVNWVNLVPTMMNRMWKLPSEQRAAFDVSSLRAVWHMASICPQWLKQAWIDWLGPDRIFEMYGGTEVIGTTVITGREWLTHKGSVGKVSAGFRMRILDEEGNERPAGEIGGIYFLPDAGRSSTYRYIGAEATAFGDWETYGDLGHVDAEGYLYIADRRTDMIVSGGANIFPAEIEAALDQHPDVRSSIVIGLPDADLGQRTHAIVQVAEADRARTDGDALRAFLSERLVRYKIPRTFEFTNEYLRDDAGKARRSQLRAERTADA